MAIAQFNVLALLAASTLSAQSTTGWQLVWNDEFNGPANSPPDSMKWSYDLGNGGPKLPGWGNHELEFYTNSTANVFQDGTGNLIVSALSTSGTYTSGRIKTQGKFSFEYGMVIVRAKIPYAQGIWPAIWMLGAGYPNVPWPNCGEIDIMENFGVMDGDASVNHGTLHGPGDTGIGITSAYRLPNGQMFSDDFHVFALQWTPDGVTFFVDGNSYLNIPSVSMPPGWRSALANPFFLIMNVAVGGSPAPVGYPDNVTLFPQQMLIDYVRVYQELNLATRFVPITPCRIADTRNAQGPRDFAIPNSDCGIPSDASAYSLNVGVIPTASLGYLTLWAAGQPQPLVATLSSDGRIKSNAAIAAGGTGGTISVFATDATDLVLDINGYFVPAINNKGLAFYPVTPCRIVDTRDPSAPLGGPMLAASTSRTFPILAGPCGVPSSAQVYSLNFTALPTGSLRGITAWPSGQPQPTPAILTAPTGSITANAVVVSAGNNGDLDVFTTDDTDLVIDINGYFAPAVPGGLSLYLDVPCRVLDTRGFTETSQSSATTDLKVIGGPCGASVAAQAFVLNAAVVPLDSLGYLTMWPQGEPQPLASTLNAPDGAITSNMAIVPTTDGSIAIFPSDPAQLVIDIFGFFAP
jgi:beta-glucanase (GH16 family)